MMNAVTKAIFNWSWGNLNSVKKWSTNFGAGLPTEAMWDMAKPM